MLESINVFLLELAPIATVLAGTAITTLVAIFLRKYTAKLDTDMAKAVNDIVMDAVIEGVGYVEQLAKQARSRNEELRGVNKLHKAATYIRTELEKRGIVDITNTEIQSKIESMLGQGMTDGSILTTEGGLQDDQDLVS